MLFKNHAGFIPETTWAYHILVGFFNFLSALSGCRRVDDSSNYLYAPKPVYVKAVSVTSSKFFAIAISPLHLKENDISYAMRLTHSKVVR
jgi:hypothetical protein